MLIRVKQINQNELALFVEQFSTGTAFSGALTNYVNSSGYLGPQVVYITGNQTVDGQKIFVQTPLVPYTGLQSGTISKQYVDDVIGNLNNNFISFANSTFVHLTGVNFISGTNIFSGSIYVPTPTGAAQAVNVSYVDTVTGILYNLLQNVSVSNVVYLTGNQIISGNKTFITSPTVPNPSNSGDAANKFYVDNATINFQVSNVVNATGDQIVSGIKTFIQSPIVPLGTQANQAVNLAQLNALGTVMGPITGFAGVNSINGTSGASGNVYLQGAGTVSIYQCGPIFYISGATANNTQLYSVNIPLVSGITGINYSFSSGFQNTPNIVGTLNVTGTFNINGLVIKDYIIRPNTGGFVVGFSTGIPANNIFSYTINAIPVPSGTGQITSGFLGIQGQPGLPGLSPNPRGAWSQGLVYSPLDFVYLTGLNVASYICTSTHISTTLNQPVSTGNSFWQIFSSGIMGPSGYWQYNGNFNSGALYFPGNSASYLGSSYGFTGFGTGGFTFSSGILPTSSGWALIASKGDIGYLLNSGIITGNFVNLSFFLDPVATGLAMAEAFVSRSFNLTGFALGAVTSGQGPFISGGILTGKFYKRNLDNSQEYFQTFTFDSGIYSSVVGNIAIPITGMQRIGFDIINSISGISKFSIGVFGFGV